MDDRLEQAIKSVKQAEKMAPVGSQEHTDLVKAALYRAWPTFEAFFALNTRK